MLNHSFAVMAYKDSPYLPQCLDSLLAQSVKSHIYLATSTPSEYITTLSKKYGIDLYITDPGLGIAHDWNFSLHAAKTKYVTLAHQDDLYAPEYAANCYRACEKFKNTLICFTDYDEILDHKKRSKTLLLITKKIMLRTFLPIKYQTRSKIRKHILLATGCPIAAPSVMYNLEQLRDFKFSAAMSINMDWDAWNRLAGKEGSFVYVPKVLLTHRIHPGSATTAGLKANLRQQEDLIMFKRYWPDFIAKKLAKIYSRSYKSNEEKPDVS
ncbi:MAG: glycosyltransferase [Saprospiraceae bacterium]